MKTSRSLYNPAVTGLDPKAYQPIAFMLQRGAGNNTGLAVILLAMQRIIYELYEYELNNSKYYKCDFFNWLILA